MAQLAARPPGGRTDATQWDDGVIGAQACGVCHAREYADWLATPHAQAYDSLSPADREDPACLTCHSTGRQLAQQAVQCESCHGAGADYWPDFVMRDPHLAGALGMRSGADIAVCSRCHTPETPSILPFDFKRVLPLVDHGKRQRGGPS